MPFFPPSLLVRRAPGAGPLDNAIRKALYGIDPTCPSSKSRLLARPWIPQIRSWRLGASVFYRVGILAMILAMIGLWATVAYASRSGTREIRHSNGGGGEPVGVDTPAARARHGQCRAVDWSGIVCSPSWAAASLRICCIGRLSTRPSRVFIGGAEAPW